MAISCLSRRRELTADSDRAASIPATRSFARKRSEIRSKAQEREGTDPVTSTGRSGAVCADRAPQASAAGIVRRAAASMKSLPLSQDRAGVTQAPLAQGYRGLGMLDRRGSEEERNGGCDPRPG